MLLLHEGDAGNHKSRFVTHVLKQCWEHSGVLGFFLGKAEVATEGKKKTCLRKTACAAWFRGQKIATYSHMWALAPVCLQTCTPGQFFLHCLLFTLLTESSGAH